MDLYENLNPRFFGVTNVLSSLMALNTLVGAEVSQAPWIVA